MLYEYECEVLKIVPRNLSVLFIYGRVSITINQRQNCCCLVTIQQIIGQILPD